MVRPLDVAIAGGGIGGLTLAIALLKAGHRPTVYEQAPALGEVGAGITLWCNAILALREIGADRPILAAAGEVRGGECRDWRNRRLFRVQVDGFAKEYGVPNVALRRAALQNALSGQLPAEVLRLGRQVSGFSDDGSGVTLIFADGERAQADPLVGADGIHSKVRAQLRPDVKPRYADYTCFRGVINEAPLGPGEAVEYWGPGARIGTVPTGDHSCYWFATIDAPQGWKPTDASRWLKDFFRDWPKVAGMLIEATPPLAVLQNDILDLVPFHPWGKGRVTLLGDAAHAMTPDIGQGACTAIEDAVVLARALGAHNDAAAAFRAYETARWARTARLQREAHTLGWRAQRKNAFVRWLRDTAVRLMPQSYYDNSFRRLLGPRSIAN